MMQFNYTSEAWTQMVRNPQNREISVRSLADKLGLKVIAFYYSQGEYDGLLIFEAPDDESANALVFAVTAAGHNKSTKTSRLYTMEELLRSLKKANDINYTPPSGIKRT